MHFIFTCLGIIIKRWLQHSRYSLRFLRQDLIHARVQCDRYNLLLAAASTGQKALSGLKGNLMIDNISEVKYSSLKHYIFNIVENTTETLA